MSASTLNLKPYKAINIYFDATASNEVFRTAFAPNAVVIDEKTQYVGISNILKWRTDSRQQYQYTSTPIHVSDKAETTVVEAIVEGNFPGSPVTLHYEFKILNEQIVQLEITI